VINDLVKNGISEDELNKVKNQAESTLVFSEVELLNRAMQLAFAANLGNVDLANQELEKIQAVTVDQVNRIAREILVETNCSTLIYKAEK
jgi:predicted Zn-dependent peptidase